jgi:hypothetical protein
MASTYSTSLGLELIGQGEQSGTWGITTNNNFGTLVEQAITGVQTITMGDATYTLSTYQGASDESRNAVLVLAGTLTAPQNLIAPGVEKIYIVNNGTAQAVTIKTSGPGAGVSVAAGSFAQVYCDGTNFYNVTPSGNSVTGNLAVSGSGAFGNNVSVTNNITAGGNLAVTGSISAASYTGITGRVVQVVTNQYTTTVSTSSSSFVTTGHAATITPTSTSSKILVLQSGTMAQTADNAPTANSMLTIFRNSTNLAGSNGIMGNVNVGYYGSIYASIAVSLLDSPATTAATTYTVYYRNSNSSSTYNYGFGSQLANLTLLEIL